MALPGLSGGCERPSLPVWQPSAAAVFFLVALLYVNRTGIAWPYLPRDFPPAMTVYGHFATWSREGLFEQLQIQLTETPDLNHMIRTPPSP
jgi:transposase